MFYNKLEQLAHTHTNTVCSELKFSGAFRCVMGIAVHMFKKLQAVLNTADVAMMINIQISILMLSLLFRPPESWPILTVFEHLDFSCIYHIKDAQINVWCPF